MRANQPWPFFEWICRESHGNRFNYTFLLLHAKISPLAGPLHEAGIPFVHLRCRKRSDLPLLAWKVRQFCRRNSFAIVHTHFMEGCLAGLAGAFLAGIPNRVHTRHHGSFHPMSDRKRWELMFDWINNRLSTTIIAPCADVRRRLVEEGVSAQSIHTIYHGFDLDAFRDVPPDRVERLRQKYGIPEGAPVIGVMSRFTRCKGVDHVIAAFHRLLETHPSARLVLANASGPGADRVRALLAELPAHSCREIVFESDAPALYRLFDVYVFVPVGPNIEGFGQTYVEALASGVPSIFTKAGVGHEIIRDRENAWVVGYQNPAEIHQGMRALLDDPLLRERLILRGRETVDPQFSIVKHVARLESLYQSLIETNTGRRS